MSNGRLAFFNLVKQMRQAQKDFYATKGQDWQTVRKPLWDSPILAWLFTSDDFADLNSLPSDDDSTVTVNSRFLAGFRALINK